MFELILGRYVYLMIVILLAIGLYGMLGKRNLIKKLIGMNIYRAYKALDDKEIMKEMTK